MARAARDGDCRIRGKRAHVPAKETRQKDYTHARDMEAAHVSAGDRNFKGIGLF